MPPQLDPSLLFPIAEISVAFAGFSAIVVLFRRSASGLWRAGDVDRFHGMVLHAMAAAFFCLLPSGIGVFAERAPLAWAIASAVLGVQIVLHVGIVLRLASTDLAGRLSLGVGLLVAVLQALNALGVGFERQFGPYLVGVLWHVFQSGVLFVSLIWVTSQDIEAD